MSINLSLTEAFAKSTQPVGYSKICQVGQQEQQIPAIYSTLGSLISQLLGKSQSQQAFATHKLASHCANWQEWHRSETRLIFFLFLENTFQYEAYRAKKKHEKIKYPQATNSIPFAHTKLTVRERSGWSVLLLLWRCHAAQCLKPNPTQYEETLWPHVQHECFFQ